MKAQQITSLVFSPSNVSVVIDQTATITLDVIDGSNLNAYDLFISYNEEVITLESWSHGTYFSSLAIIRQENLPGLLHLVVTQMATAGVSGDGTLLELVFRGVKEGLTTVEITDIELVTSEGVIVAPNLYGSVISVTSEKMPTITPLQTFTASATPSVTSTNSLQKTPTPNWSVTGTTTVESGRITATLLSGTPTFLPGNSTSQSSMKTAYSSGLTQTAIIQETLYFQVSPSYSSLESLSDRGMHVTQEGMPGGITTPGSSTMDKSSNDRIAVSKRMTNNILWILLISLMVVLTSMVVYYHKCIRSRKFLD